VRKALVFAAVFAAVPLAAAGTVWIDTDVSIGSPFREVDDAYALVMAFHSPEIRIAGIGTSYGNASLAYTTRRARELTLRFAPGGVRVFAGATSPNDLGRRSEASEALAKVLEKNSVTYIALGPLTNLASFLRLHPQMARRIERVIFVGGQIEGTTLGFGPTRSFRIHDANVFKDPRAAALVLAARIPVTLASVATGSNVMLDAGDLRALSEHGSAGGYLARRSKVWLWFWTKFVGTNGGPVFDVLAVVAAARPDVISTERRYTKMADGGELIVSRQPARDRRPVRFVTGFSKRTKRVILERSMQ
jgi:inosine-uridine nucleoside N-ribohydrolase